MTTDSTVFNVVIPDNITRKQKLEIDHILRDIPYYDFHNSNKFEIKTFEINVNGFGIVDLYFVTGMIDDEGTLAGILCRKYRHVFIGKRGGLSMVSDKGSIRNINHFDLMNRYYRH